eukprot:GHVP01014711.1.p1 GENE.GHVP01014711.1~~GHVP01014711.1.p1  ORF type:complete len:148 (-),score=16.87 GHVP01014711.1:120-533(-)
MKKLKDSIIPQENKDAILMYLITEGVLVLKKTPLGNHPQIGVPNLHVKLMLRSLVSRNYVTEIFSWGHHYYVLKNEGVEYLKSELKSESLVPKTQKARQQDPERSGGYQGGAQSGGYGRGGYSGGFRGRMAGQVGAE